MLTFAEYLRQERLSRGLTMQSLAAHLKVSAQFISLLESGSRRPSRKLLARCAEFFKEDLNYLTFLAQPIPMAQRRALFESPSAPDYIPRAVRDNILVQDSEDLLIQNLLLVPNLPLPEHDSPYHALTPEPLEPSLFDLPQQLIEQIRNESGRFAPRARAWAEFYNAYFLRHREGRQEALSALEATVQLVDMVDEDVIPPKLRFLIGLHLGLAYQEQSRFEDARDCYDQARRHAHAMSDPSAVVTALWNKADTYRAEGDILSMLQTLTTALETPEVPPFGIARCRSDAVEAHLILEDNETALEHIEHVIRLWRSATLEAPQSFKSLALLRAEAAAMEACTRLGRDEEARAWLNRVRAVGVRIDVPQGDDVRIRVSVAVLIWRGGRPNQGRRQLEGILDEFQPDDEAGRAIRDAARLSLKLLDISENNFTRATTTLAEMDAEPPMTSDVRELRRQGEMSFAKCQLARATENPNQVGAILEQLEAALQEAIEGDARIGETSLVSYLQTTIQQWRSN